MPEIARVILDQLATDPDLQDASSALSAHLRDELPSAPLYSAARQYCLAHQKGGNVALLSMPSKVKALPSQVRKLLRHSFIQVPLAAEQIAICLSSHRLRLA